MEEKYVTHYKDKEIEIPVEVLDDLYNKQVKPTGWGVDKNNHQYYFICTSGIILSSRVTVPSLIDDQNCNAFSSRELANNIMRYEILNRKILKRISEICEPVDWNDGKKTKYLILYNYCRNLVTYSLFTNIQYSCWYCDTLEHAEQIISEFKEDLIWYFTEFKTRMDG